MPRSQEGLARLVERQGTANPRIVEAFRSVDRADFVPENHRRQAYLDRPVGIPERQTTSQPSLIARMLEVADPKPEGSALEVGTGFGFQTALLSYLCAEVVSVERWKSLAEAARANLERAGIENVMVVVGDGWNGCPDKAPFSSIVVPAAAAELPAALTEQLDDDGRLVIPLAEPTGDNVYLFEKKGGRVRRTTMVTPARFVPLVRNPSGE
jgi:protein-L-isoaspartate(D-aspartate) O-methyltransferase